MVKAQPRAKRAGVMGVADSAAGPRLKLAVTEAAEDGKANRAVCALLADVLDRPRAAVEVLTGASHREKVLTVTGDPAELAEKLRNL